MISIIMPVYNSGLYLREMIDSILAQSYRNWELVLVDDGSKDNSGEICEQYASTDNRIRVIHQQNAGVGEARNTGLRLIQGDYVYFADSDDSMEPEMLQKMVDVVDRTGADVVRVDYWDDYADSSVEKGRCDGSVESFCQAEATMKVYHNEITSYLWSMLFRRTVIQNSFPNLRTFEDYCAVFKWIASCNKLVWLHEPLYHYRQRQDSLMNHLHVGLDCPRDFMTAIQARYDAIKRTPLVEKYRDDIILTYQKNLLKNTKNAVRSDCSAAERFFFMMKVMAILKQLPNPGMKLGLKYTIRYDLLMHSPRLFQSLVRRTAIFSARHHRKARLFKGAQEA